MATRNIFTCDRCGYEQGTDRKFADSDRWLYTVTLYMRTGHHPYNSIPYRLEDSRDVDRLAHVLWCDHCVNEHKLHDLKLVSRPSEPPEINIEMIIREFVAEAIANAKG